jgi:eukaryotic-like serine/threonine-protein kinase
MLDRPSASAHSGERIGRYQTLRRLAVGGMAEIYLARLPGVGLEGFEKLVVLKRILPQHALDPELLRMFVDEARLTAALTHPHITEVYDVGTDGTGPFFAMEYVHGANVRELLRAHARTAGDPDAPLPLAAAIGIVAAAASGLHYAHERRGPSGEPLGIVHRDVSPSNVLVSYDGSVKVSDFGIAKWAFQRTRTQEGTLKGKFAYMSPEQCRATGVDRRSDVFALGTILYELTAGVAPFRGDSDLDILNRIAGGQAEPPTWAPKNGEYPQALAAIVMRALASDPDDRFPTMQAFQLALEGFARDAALSLSNVVLEKLMRALFADELAAWRAAERAGRSLGEHLADHPPAPRVGAPERTVTDTFAAGRPPSKRPAAWTRALGLAVFAAAFAVGGGLAAKRWRAAESAPRPAASRSDLARAVDSVTAAGDPDPRAAPVARSPGTTNPPTDGAAHMAVAADTNPFARRAGDVGRAEAAKRTRTTRAPRAPAPSARPSAESLLGAWDPDSPTPP